VSTFLKIIGIYLAAGKSIRMGRNKLELPFGKDFLGAAAFRAALDSKLDATFVITRKGDFPRFLSSFFKRKGWSYLHCVEGNSGLSASVKTGVMKAIEWGADAIVIFLADQPFVNTDCINCLIDEFKTSPKYLFVSASQNGILKPPVLFAKALFPDLMKLKGDEGARMVLQGEWKEHGKSVKFDDYIFQDADTLVDYDSMLDHLRSDEIGSDR
jgi:molybdenum cofactor cytidylyltransferase